MTWRALQVVFLGWLTGSCSGQASPSARAPLTEGAAAAAHQSEVERYLPLTDDTVFTYAVWLPESVEPEQLILQVERRSKGRANLRSGSSVKRLELVADGIRLVTGGYLLKAPLGLGAGFAGPTGRVRVTAVEQNVSVPAGTFVGCVETTEAGVQGPSSRAIVTTYCPEVGIVKLSVDDGERRERFELKAFGPYIRIQELTD